MQLWYEEQIISIIILIYHPWFVITISTNANVHTNTNIHTNTNTTGYGVSKFFALCVLGARYLASPLRHPSFRTQLQKGIRNTNTVIANWQCKYKYKLNYRQKHMYIWWTNKRFSVSIQIHIFAPLPCLHVLLLASDPVHQQPAHQNPLPGDWALLTGSNIQCKQACKPPNYLNLKIPPTERVSDS